MSSNPSTAFSWAKWYYFFPLIIAVGLVLFVTSFPSRDRISSKGFILLILGFAVLAIPLVVNKSFLTESLVYHPWGKEVILNRSQYFPYASYLLVCYLSSIFIMYKKSLTEKGLFKKQASMFYKGFLGTAIFALSFNLILPWLGNYKLIWLGPLFTSIFLVAIAYSVSKHRMFDLRLFFVRSLAYALSLGILMAGYMAASQLITAYILAGSRSSRFEPTSVLLIIFATLSYGPVKRFFDKITSGFFYRDAYDPQALLDSLNKLLVSTTHMTQLLEGTNESIVRNIKPMFSVFGLRESELRGRRIISTGEVHFSDKDISRSRQLTPLFKNKVIVADNLEDEHQELYSLLARNNVAVLIRLVDDVSSVKEGIGYLALGPKKSGNPYSKQDVQTLEIIANELVIAIQNVLRFEEIQQFNLTLQEKVERATKQLKHANDKLVTLNDTKDDFISMASHQLRTPLTAVKGNISMVLDGDYGKIPKQLHEPLGQAFNSSERMVGLIADLLNVSRLRTGKFAIQPVSSNLDSVVQSELQQLKESARSHRLKLTYDRPKDFPTLMLDEIKVRQVIMNFVDNAIYYTPPGGQIKVTLKHSPKAIEFTVEDNGIGVPRDLQHHLFTKFYRASNAQKMRPDGTGIGLFMAKKVIIASGGSVIFRSVEGKGSTFGFTIPLAKLADAQPVVVTDEPITQE